jgi:hypothetical protein
MFDTGTRGKDQHTLNIQPVIPVALNSDWHLINRLVVPAKSFPTLAPGTSRQSGIGDLSYAAWLSPNTKGTSYWGFGPAVVVPMVTDPPLGTGKWSIGPSAIVCGMKGRWVCGALVSNVWSFAGDESRADVNLMILEPFINYNLENGWYLTSTPIIEANWEAPFGERWTIPIGGGFGKCFFVGDQTVTFSMEAFGYAQAPPGGPQWAARFQLNFLFPK